MKWIAAILLFTGCVETEFQIDSQLRPYFNEFVLDARQHGIKIESDNLLMTIKDLRDKKDLGLFVESGYQRYVYIDSTMFYERNKDVSFVVHHELGHAFLKRVHNNKFSYMNPEMVIFTRDKIKIDSLNNELFR